ncbi:unnamed protein product, partial [Staurois parvus]
SLKAPTLKRGACTILPTRVCFSSAVPLLSSAFLAAISSASWQQSHQLHLAAALVTEGCFHTWMSSDSQLTGPLHSPSSKHGCSLSSSCSLNSV